MPIPASTHSSYKVDGGYTFAQSPPSPFPTISFCISGMTPSAFGLSDVIDPPQPASKLDPLDLHEHSTVDHVNFETPRPSEVWGESTADGDYAQEMRDSNYSHKVRTFISIGQYY